MMFKKFLMLLLVFSLFGSAMSQEYVPMLQSGNEWHVFSSYYPGAIYIDGGAKFILGDTVILDQIAYVTLLKQSFVTMNGFLIYPITYNPVITPIAYLREDTALQTVVMRQSSNFGNTIYPLYDFSVSVGDTMWNFYEPLVVEAIGNIDLANGETRKFIGFTQESVWNGDFIIEGIGGTEGPHYSLIEGLGTWNELRCFKSDSVHLFGNECVEPVGIRYIELNTKVNLTPNPASDIIKLEFDETIVAPLNLYNALGEMVLADEIDGKTHIINISHLSPGIYFYQIENLSGKLLVE